MTLDPFATGDALRSASSEIVRLWRAARAEARVGVFPGLLDGLVAPLVDRAGEALSMGGGDPAEVWAGAAGLVRVDPRFRRRSAGEIEAELAILGSVLDSVCEAVSADPGAAAFLRAVVAAARAGSAALADGRPPTAVAVVLALSGTAYGRRAELAGQ